MSEGRRELVITRPKALTRLAWQSNNANFTYDTLGKTESIVMQGTVSQIVRVDYMVNVPNASSSSNFQSILNAALEAYEKKT